MGEIFIFIMVFLLYSSSLQAQSQRSCVGWLKGVVGKKETRAQRMETFKEKFRESNFIFLSRNRFKSGQYLSENFDDPVVILAYFHTLLNKNDAITLGGIRGILEGRKFSAKERRFFNQFKKIGNNPNPYLDNTLLVRRFYELFVWKFNQTEKFSLLKRNSWQKKYLYGESHLKRAIEHRMRLAFLERDFETIMRELGFIVDKASLSRFQRVYYRFQKWHKNIIIMTLNSLKLMLTGLPVGGNYSFLRNTKIPEELIHLVQKNGFGASYPVLQKYLRGTYRLDAFLNSALRIYMAGMLVFMAYIIHKVWPNISNVTQLLFHRQPNVMDQRSKMTPDEFREAELKKWSEEYILPSLDMAMTEEKARANYVSRFPSPVSLEEKSRWEEELEDYMEDWRKRYQHYLVAREERTKYITCKSYDNALRKIGFFEKVVDAWNLESIPEHCNKYKHIFEYR